MVRWRPKPAKPETVASHMTSTIGFEWPEPGLPSLNCSPPVIKSFFGSTSFTDPVWAPRKLGLYALLVLKAEMSLTSIDKRLTYLRSRLNVVLLPKYL